MDKQSMIYCQAKMDKQSIVDIGLQRWIYILTDTSHRCIDSRLAVTDELTDTDVLTADWQ